jgi:ribose transport system permease protein
MLGPAIAFVVITLVVALTTERFLQPTNLSNLALQVSVVSIVAIGTTMVILTAGVDLSPGSAIALISLSMALFITQLGFPLWLAILAAITLGGAIGAANGVVVAYFRIPSFIATLAALSGLKGLALLLTDGAPVFSVSDDLSAVFYGDVAGIPLPFIYVAVCYLVAAVLLNHTQWGRKVYAVGGNPIAARLSGIGVQRVQFQVFMLAGLFYGVGAVLFAARLNSGSANYGSGMELQAIAAAVIGGTSLAGGRGNVLATLIGALTITIVQNAMNLNGIGSSTQSIIVGVIILAAVGIDVWRPHLSRFVRRFLLRQDSLVVPGGAARAPE